MKHLNDNALVSVAIKITGPRAYFNELIEISLVVLDHKLEPDKRYLPFIINLKPSRIDNFDYEYLRIKYFQKAYSNKFYRTYKKYLEKFVIGVDQFEAVDLLNKWVNKLKLKPNKKLMPLAYHWDIDRSFIVDWLGWHNFDLIFHEEARDLVSCGSYENDIADWRIEPYPQPKLDLQYFCSQQRVKRDGTIFNSMDDAIAISQVYRKMIQKTML